MMGFVGNLLGVGGGGGSGFSAQPVPTDNPLDSGEINVAQEQALKGINQQQAFVNALNQQNGLGNQSSVFNQLQGVANGTGPNPALAQLNQTTGANVANQAALMAGQRGAGANPALLARLAAMQGANTQQQAVGQAATMQANQQLGALNQLGGIAGQQAQQQQAGLSGLNQATLQNQGQLISGLDQQNKNKISMMSNINNANAGMAGTNANNQAGLFGGVLGGVGSALGVFGAPAAKAAGAALAHGGSAGYADGGSVSGPQSFAANYFNGMGSAPQTSGQVLNQGMSSLSRGIGSLFHSNPTNPMLANAPIAMPAAEVMPQNTMMASDGGKVPGKAQVAGDSYANDTVSAKLSPGEIVIPRSIIQGQNPVQMAAKFVEQELLKQHMSKKNRLADGGTAGSSFANAASQFGNAISPLWSGSNPDASFNDILQGASQNAADIAQGPSAPPAPPAITAEEIANIPQSPVTASNEINPGVLTGTSGGLPAGGELNATSSASPVTPKPFNEADNYQKALGEQTAGLKGEAAASQQLAQDQLAAANKEETALKEQQEKDKDNFDKLEVERQKFATDVANHTIDPNKYVGDMSTGGKFATAIGLILGGIGGGLTHQENPALKFLNNQIENDMKAQEANLGKSKNLLSMNMERFRDLNLARTQSRIDLATMAEVQMKQAKAKSSDPMAQALMQQAIGQLHEKFAPLQAEAARKMTGMQAAQSGDLGAAIERLADPKQKESLYKEYAVKQESDSLRQMYQEQFQHLQSKALNGTFSPADRQSAIQAVAGKIQKATEGRYNLEAATQLAQALFPNRIESGDTTKNKLARGNELLGGLSATPQLDTFSRMHGIQSKQEDTSPPEIKTMGGVKFQKVQGGWKRVS